MGDPRRHEHGGRRSGNPADTLPVGGCPVRVQTVFDKALVRGPASLRILRNQLQNNVGLNGDQVALSTKVPRIAAPPVILWPVNKTCPHGIQVDIAGRFQQVLIAVDDRAMESASKQVPPPVLPTVERSGITTV